MSTLTRISVQTALYLTCMYIQSSLLMAILRELQKTDGCINIQGELSYCSQQPWIFSSSIRQNILFGMEHDTEKYHTVVEMCCLIRDLDELAHGDQSRVGERGITLSGGQKARINLARTVYRGADIVIMDDPLSAVDTAVGKRIFEK